ncbi:MAG: hypothetical protein NTZ20_04765 [Candidatus Levybacteria bacterium]|nr:hypothetical protein [Candidatus Levybacteria bacterium]
MTKGSALPTANTLSSGDYFFVISDPNTLIATKKIYVNTAFSNVSHLTVNNLVISNKSTPSNSTMTIGKGKIFYDDNYLYVPTANNVIRRIALVAF